MSIQYGEVVAPIGLQELYSNMGLAPYKGNYDLGYLCGNSHGKINKWAWHKPIRYNTQGEITDTQRRQETQVSDLGDRVVTVQVNGLEFAKATSLGYGNGTGTFVCSKGFLAKLTAGTLPKPNYLAPRPGQDWSRLTDFEGYRHASPPLFPRFPGGTQRVRYVGSGTLVPFDQEQTYDGYGDYFQGKGLYLCAVAWWNNGQMDLMSLGTYMNRLGQKGIMFKSIPQKNAELSLRLFLSSQELYQGNFGGDSWGAAGTFYSADDHVGKANIFSSGYRHDIELWQCMYNQTGRQIRFAFRIYENAPGKAIMVQPRLYFYNSSAAGDIGMGWQKLMDITPHDVPGESYLNFIITVNKPAFKGGEKLRFVAYFSAGNTVDITAQVEAYDPVKWQNGLDGMDLTESAQTVVITQ